MTELQNLPVEKGPHPEEGDHAHDPVAERAGEVDAPIAEEPLEEECEGDKNRIMRVSDSTSGWIGRPRAVNVEPATMPIPRNP